jgi:hypothetical protein
VVALRDNYPRCIMIAWLKRIFATRPSGAADWIAILRHRKLCTAIPFPSELSWLNDEESNRSLDKLYVYAEDLANSAIDWYLKKKFSKKVLSIGLRYASYAFVIIGAAVPLIKIFNADALRSMFGPAASDISAISVEAALVLIGIAGGLHAIDGLIGASSGWRRYIATAMQINQRLLSFRFQWNELVGEARLMQPASPPKEPPSCQPGGEEYKLTLIRRKFELLRSFCLGVTEIVRDETTDWAAEFSNSVAQFEKQLPASHVLRPQSRP